MTSLPLPRPGREAAEAYVAQHFAHLVCDGVRGSGSFTGGQVAADSALAAFDITGYATRRNEVYPPSRRGASRLSPYIRHGLLSLPDVWDHVAAGPRRDVEQMPEEVVLAIGPSMSLANRPVAREPHPGLVDEPSVALQLRQRKVETRQPPRPSFVRRNATC